MPKSKIIESLRDTTAVEELVDHFLTFFLDQPLNSVFDSADLAKALSSGLKQAVHDPNFPQEGSPILDQHEKELSGKP